MFVFDDAKGVKPRSESKNPVGFLGHEQADYFGKAYKVMFIAADSLFYDFGRLAPLEFILINGTRNFQHLLHETREAYAALAPGGWLCWHEGEGPAGAEARRAIAAAKLPDLVCRVADTQIAFLQKDPAHSRSRISEEPLVVVWEGDVDAVHSLATVNRGIVERLTHRGHLVSVRPTPSIPSHRLPAAHPGAAVGRPFAAAST